MASNEGDPQLGEPLIQESVVLVVEGDSLRKRVWVESKKLWYIAGPAIFGRLASYSMNVVSQAFAGHIGDIELAAIAISYSVIVGFNFGLLLGMASALETLCGQAFGAKRFNMLGVYLQRSWIVLFICCVILLPFYIFATPILKLLGQTDEVAEMSGTAALWLIPLHFSYAFAFPLQRFLQSQMKTFMIAYLSVGGLVVGIFTTWLFVYVFDWGLVGLCIALDLSWWVQVFGLFIYVVGGWCPLTWKGFSIEAFSGLGEFVKLSAGSGVMLCLENWYYRILLLMTGGFTDSEIALDALTVCITINGWELMIPISFLAATGVRVANELGRGNAEGAKFATKVSVTTSSVIGVIFCVLIVILRDKIGLLFTSSADVLEEVDKLAILLAFTILLNSVQPVLSGVAVGSGWQWWVAYINLGCYYFVGIPLGIVLAWVFGYGVMGLWAGMIFGGTAVQTILLSIIVIRCDWEKEVEKAKTRVKKWSTPNPSEES